MNNMYELLTEEIRLNKITIQKTIGRFEKEKANYKNIDITKDLIMTLRCTGSEKLMCIGFPFPLESYPLASFKSKKNTSIFIYLRGEILRQSQRNAFLDEIRKIRKTEYIELKSLKDFRKITKKLCSSYKKADYFDPYSYKGDSFIGLYFINNFTRTYNLLLSTIHSENYRDLECVSSTKGYVEGISKKDVVLNIFANLLDNHWSRVSEIVCQLVQQRLPSIIIGRDLIVIPQNGTTTVYHFKREEVILKSGNIEDYMSECLWPYLNPIADTTNPINIKSQNIMINPFGSEPDKTLSLSLVVKIIMHLNNKYPQLKILFISGFHNSYPHIIYTSKLEGLIHKKNLNNVIIVNYGSFRELVIDIKKHDIAFGITADTSIAHLFNHLGLRNITCYNLNRCDLKSPQSLSSDGPLGFCRYGPIQYPAIINKDETSLAKGVNGGIDYFLGHSSSKEWCKYIFEDKLLISKIDSDDVSLIESNKKINPLYKIQND